MAGRYRQEVFNVLLAQLLQERGIVSAPEEIIKATPRKLRRIPDVIVNFYGLRTAIEGEVSDQPRAEDNSLESALNRVVEGIAHIGVAVIYPARLRKIAFNNLKNELANSQLRLAVVTESDIPEFTEGDIDYMANVLRHTFDQLVQEDAVTNAVAALESGIEKFASNVLRNPGVVNRIAEILGIRELPKSESPELEEQSE